MLKGWNGPACEALAVKKTSSESVLIFWHCANQPQFERPPLKGSLRESGQHKSRI